MINRFLTMIVVTLAFIFAGAFAVAAEGDVYTIEAGRGEAIVQDTLRPIATIVSAENKYEVSIGGNINMKASYDFGGSISHPDFITSMIDASGGYISPRRFGMDATTSRIEIRGRASTKSIGDVELCLNADFRGGSVGSYMPRVRLAYISFSDFVVGRNFTTFCDMGAAAPNIDFQGPNVSPYIYTTQVRYVKSICDDRWRFGVAMEYEPYQSSSLGDHYGYEEQYIPNIPAYVQRNMGASHIRLTGLYKSVALYDTSSLKSLNLNGWGTQLSGSIGVSHHLKLYYSATCGEGITNYIQDLYGSGLDATINAETQRPELTFMYGWQAAGLVQITDKAMVSAGYSIVNIEGSSDHFVGSDYRRGEYLFANIFYALSPRINLATEFLWGSRQNVDGGRGVANRFNTMVQYSF